MRHCMSRIPFLHLILHHHFRTTLPLNFLAFQKSLPGFVSGLTDFKDCASIETSLLRRYSRFTLLQERSPSLCQGNADRTRGTTGRASHIACISWFCAEPPRGHSSVWTGAGKPTAPHSRAGLRRSAPRLQHVTEKELGEVAKEQELESWGAKGRKCLGFKKP